MAQSCRVCSHSQTNNIEKDIVNGVPHTTIGKKYGIHFQSVRYHSENHLPEKLVQAAEAKEQNHAETILDGINTLLGKTKGILEQAEADGKEKLALDAIKEMRGIYELLSKIAVKLHEYQHMNGDNETDTPRTLQDLYDEEQGITSPDTLSVETDTSVKEPRPDSPRSPTQHKNTQKIHQPARRLKRTKPPKSEELDLELDKDFDLEFDDLDDLDNLPSENPEWLEKERLWNQKKSLGWKGMD